ncbi:MAG TPA: SLC13 family permease [Saprospiraceae bacterium]|nr:SLC13 family permease [Saprospiraceae bacterium]
MSSKIKILGLFTGPLIFLIMYVGVRPEGLSTAGIGALAVTLWMAIWWVTEAIPIAATALLPIFLFPLTGTMDISMTTAAFGHKYVFLYLGGFILAIAIEKWNLHKRIALNIIAFMGVRPSMIIMGFMVATAFLSMWISNTATSVMMLPIGMAVVSQFQRKPDEPLNGPFGKALMLSIAYSASIGGIATLIGTPPNLVFAGVVKEYYGIEISFAQWMMLGLPVSVILLVVCWYYLTHLAFNIKALEWEGDQQEVLDLKRSLGNIGKEERIVLIVFLCTATLWIFRSLIEKLIPSLDDTVIAMIAGITLFIIPSSKGGTPIIQWEDSVRIPWGIILLFGGGMALAEAFKFTGLALWIGSQITMLEGMSLFVFLLILIAGVNLLTELTSNLATTAMLLPVLVPVAASMNVAPLYLLVGATLAASCAFMLPVATPPNAVVFGSGYLRIPDMVKAGLVMNILSVFIITFLIYFFLSVFWDISIIH